MKYTYIPNNVCAKKMTFDIEGNIIKKIIIEGGCPGNLLGISKIITDMDINEVIKYFSDVRCGLKDTSCPDQIARALKEYKAHEKG